MCNWKCDVCNDTAKMAVTVSGRLQLQLRDREPVNHVGRMDTRGGITRCHHRYDPAVMTCMHHSRELAVRLSRRVAC